MAHDDDSEAKASSIEAAYKQFDADFLSAMNQAKKNCIKSPQTDEYKLEMMINIQVFSMKMLIGKHQIEMPTAFRWN